MLNVHAKLAFLFVASLALSACGGGGGEDEPQNQAKADLMPMKVVDEIFYYYANGVDVGHRLQVINQGEGEAPACTVQVTYSTFAGPVTIMLPVPALAPGAMSLPLFTPLPSGSTTSRYTVLVDVDGVVDETDETNNEAEEVVLF